MSYIEHRKVNYHDIAAAAKVSTATVSLALRNHPSIGAKTREKIRRIATEMGYVSDARLNSLMSYVRTPKKRLYTESIAYVYNVPVQHEAKGGLIDYKLVWQSAAESARQLGYEMKLFNMQKEKLNGTRLSEVLLSRGIRGVYLAKNMTPRHSLRMRWENFTAITLGYSLKSPDLHRVARYHQYGSQLAVNQLKERGYLRIGFAVGPTGRKGNNLQYQWLSGYMGAVYTSPGLERIAPYLSEPNPKAFTRWLNENRPDAVISNRDEVYHMLGACGYACPGDIGFAHLNRYFSQVDCAGVVECPREYGAIAARQLIGSLHRNEQGIPKSPITTLVKGSWREGATVRELPDR